MKEEDLKKERCCKICNQLKDESYFSEGEYYEICINCINRSEQE